MDCKGLFEEYKKVNERIKNAEKFLANNKIPIQQREKWKPEYDKLKKKSESIENRIKGISSNNFIKEYNAAIQEYHRLEKDVTESNQEEFIGIVKKLGKLMYRYKILTGNKMDKQEELNGF